MTQRRTTGASPLDAVIPRGRHEKGHRGKAVPETVKTTKERVTFQLPPETIDRARNAVFWTPGATMAALMEEALSAYLDRLERKRGKPFPPRSSALRTGRPVKVA